MSRRALVLLVTTMLAVPGAATAKPKPKPCPGGRFLIAGAPIVAGASGLATDAVVVGGGKVTIASGCAATRATVKAGKSATTVTAAWRSCAHLQGGARLTARIPYPACDALTGTLVTPRARPKRRAVAGRLGRCGDGIVDPDAKEVCDPAAGGCSGGARCAAADEPNPCRCVAVPPTTLAVTATSTTTTSTTLAVLPPLAACRSAVKSGSIAQAATACAAAAATAPDDAEALLLAAATGIPDGLVRAADLVETARAYGFVVGGPGLSSPAASGDVALAGEACGFAVSHPGVVPLTAPTSDVLPDLLRKELLPIVDATIARLSMVPPAARVTFSFADLPPCLRLPGARTVEVDRGDVLAARGALQLLGGLIELTRAYDVGIDVADTVDNRRTPRDVFLARPGLLKLRSGSGVPAAVRTRFDAGLADLIAAVDAILTESDDQSDDLLVIDPADLSLANRAKAAARRVRDALSGTAVFEASIFGIASDQRLDLRPLLDGQIADARPLVPGFDAAGNPDPCAVGDPTFLGMAPDMTTPALRSLLHLRCP